MKKRAKVPERYSAEQRAWIARARVAPSQYKAARDQAREIVRQLQANQRREAK